MQKQATASLTPPSLPSVPDTTSLYRRVWSLAWPIAGSNFLLRGAGIADTMMVGHLGGIPLAGVALAQVMLFLALAIPRGLGVGGQVMVAFYTGEGNNDKRREMAAAAVVLGAIATAALSISFYPLIDTLMRILGGTSEVVSAAHSYLVIYLAFFTFSGLLFGFSSIFQGAGDTKTPLYVTAIVNGIHILVAYPLILGKWGLPQIGIPAAAWVTGFCELGGVITLAVIAVRRGLWSPKLKFIKKAAIREVWAVAHSAIAERLLVTGMFSAFTRLLMTFGPAAFATTRIGIDMQAFAFLPALGFAQAATTLVGFHIGAGDAQTARRAGWATANICLGFMTVMGLSYFFFGEQWMRLFTNDPDVLAHAVDFGHMAAFNQLPLAYTLALAGALRGAGETRWVMFGPIIGGWIFRIPLAYMMAYHLGFGVVALWWTIPADWLIRMIWTTSRFRGGQFKLERDRAGRLKAAALEAAQQPPREAGM